MEKTVKKQKKDDFSKLSNIKTPINIKSILKFNILNSLIVIILVYFAILSFNLFGSADIGFRSPAQPPILSALLKFILLATVILSVLGWLVLAYYKRLNNERPS
ncbi:hypothetical protein J4455_00665 [Candidatus Woesearchaeota archaeon]|nr:hypothetical protein [Candidatus Woesearchaeota archaeon]